MSFQIPLWDGNDIPKIGLGAFRRDSDEEVRAVVDSFLTLTFDLPVKHVEISELFGNGHVVLDALLAKGLTRGELYLTFKVWPKARLGQDIITSCVDCLALTNQTYFDLILIHAPIDLKNKFQQWTALEFLKDRGLVKSIGVCKYSETQLVELMKNCQSQPAVCQIESTPFGLRAGIVEYCSDSSIVVLCNNVQAKRVRSKNLIFNKTAETIGISPLELHIQWAMAKGFAITLSPDDLAGLEHLTLSLIDQSLLEPLNALEENVITSCEFIASSPVEEEGE